MNRQVTTRCVLSVLALALAATLLSVLQTRAGGTPDGNSIGNMEFVSACETPGFARGLYVRGATAYITDWHKGLRVLDVSNPSDPREIGSCKPPGGASGVHVTGDLAYVAGYSEGLGVVDVSDPSNPSVIGFCPIDWEDGDVYGGVYASGDLAYLVDGHLHIIDISDPSDPVKISEYDRDLYKANTIYATEDTAFVANKSHLSVIDVSDPFVPERTTYYELPGGTTDMHVKNDIAYLTQASAGLQIVDISNPDQPATLGTYEGYAYRVHVAGYIAYTFDGELLRAIDVSNPSDTARIGCYSGLDHVRGLYATADLVYATRSCFWCTNPLDDDLTILRYVGEKPTSPVYLPIVLSTNAVTVTSCL